MEFIRGAKINDKAAIEAMGIDPGVVGKNLVNIFT